MRRPTALFSLLVLTLVTACGLKPASAFLPNFSPGTLKPVAALKGVHIRVTSKEFTEQLILGKMAVIALSAEGVKVTDKTNVQGSVNARRSMTRGDADLMWDYTGTGWITYLGRNDPIRDPRRQYEAVRDLDLKRNHIAWLDPAPLNNSYTMVANQTTARKYGLKTLDDIRRMPKAQRTFCVANEFFARNDGFQGMLKDYGLRYPQDVGSVRQMSEGVIYTETAKGTCAFGEATTTDGRIGALHLAVLADDRQFFPYYNGAVVVRESVLRAHPEIASIFAQISPKLTTDVMRSLNAKVDIDGNDPVFVARDWMRSQGLIR